MHTNNGLTTKYDPYADLFYLENAAAKDGFGSAKSWEEGKNMVLIDAGQKSCTTTTTDKWTWSEGSSQTT